MNNKDLLIKLVDVIPNWKHYLTNKQIEAIQVILSFPTYELAAKKLNITVSSLKSRLYGKNKELGALKRLIRASSFLQEDIFVLSRMKLLFNIMINDTDFMSKLSDEQIQYSKQLLRLKSISKMATHFKVNQKEVIDKLIGTNKDSILEILYNEIDKKIS
jgi:hypothetical protein